MDEEKLISLKINMAELNTGVKYIKEKIDKHIERENDLNSEIKELIKDFITNTEAKFAAKWAETFLKWPLYTAGGVLIVGISKMIWEVIKLIK